jgi:amino-acid N-acetyltransferase
VKIRKAELKDVPEIFELINRFARERVMLPRTLADLYENLWAFTVAAEGGRVLGCGALKFYSEELAEIRSLCVEPGRASRGVGSALVERLLDEAESFRLKTVFALTLVPEFFGKVGFREAPREQFPLKVWRDCTSCPKYSCCDEKAVALSLAERRARRTRRVPRTATQPSAPVLST